MMDWIITDQQPQSRRPCFADAAIAVIMATYMYSKPTALKLHHQNMLASHARNAPAQRHSRQVLR